MKQDKLDFVKLCEWVCDAVCESVLGNGHMSWNLSLCVFFVWLSVCVHLSLSDIGLYILIFIVLTYKFIILLNYQLEFEKLYTIPEWNSSKKEESSTSRTQCLSFFCVFIFLFLSCLYLIFSAYFLSSILLSFFSIFLLIFKCLTFHLLYY